MIKTTGNRLLALDVMRGITIAGMILVNNPGSWSSVYAPLKHAPWNGLTPTDLVFPFFMFIMGISTCISLRKYNFEATPQTVWKIVRRSMTIFAIGLGIAWFSLFCRTWNALSTEDLSFWQHIGQSAWTFDRIRILGVLQRLALSYFAASFIILLMKHKHIPYLIAALLLGYMFILLFGNGFAYDETNLLSIVDRSVLGIKHIYKDNGIEPEGLLSTIPSIAHVLTGFYCGKMLIETFDAREKILRLFLIGATMMFCGFLLDYGCPINKKIWSPTFVLTTCGLASSLLALLVWIIDVKGYQRWSRFFESFGVNPLILYALAAFLSILLGNIRLTYNETTLSLHGYLYGVILKPSLGDYFGSLTFAVLFVVAVWTVGYVLYKRKIYIKI